MQQAPITIILLLGLCGLLSVYLAAWVQHRSKVPGTREFFALLIFVALYSVGYAIELSRSDLNSVMAAIRFEYLAIPYVPLLMFLFVLRFIRQKPTPWYVITLLVIIPFTTMLLVFTSPSHSLYYINPRIENASLFPVIVFERAIWYYVQLAYLVTLISISVVFMTIHAFRSNRKQRFQSITIALGTFLPFLGFIIFMYGAIPGGFDPGPFGVTLTGLLLTIALTKLGLFELVPAARELALDSIQDCFLVIDKYGRLQDLNKAAWRLPGASELSVGSTLPANNILTSNLQPLIENEKDLVEFSADCLETGERFYNAKAYKIQTNHSHIDGTAILISDITESAELMRLLSLQANTDELTGILNRRYLIKLGIHEVDWSRRNNLPIGVIMIDLDHFKLFNDKYGHAAGDEILIKVSKCFHDALRNVDILGRFGGEEFVVFLPGADFNTTAQVAGRLKDHLVDCKIMINRKMINVTASYGIHSSVAESATTVDELLRLADLALYQAKARGRNCVAWSSDLTVTTYSDTNIKIPGETRTTRTEDRDPTFNSDPSLN